MKRLIFIIILVLPFLLLSENSEKRLALVIGNANYENNGELKNPVNDAVLVSNTLDSLGFEVMLHTNIPNKFEFDQIVLEFGEKRSDYDVAFVYYAGHAVQIGSINYLLPTKVNFKSEKHVRQLAFNVQDLMMWLDGVTDQVNVLILDACRDNPYETKWNRTRSVKGSGLAKMSPPTGSLIAFSTAAGKTADDGDGDNTIYCMSLCKNLKKKNISLDQVFRNVRSDVLKLTNGNQRPVESSQLTGNEFFLIKNDYQKQLKYVKNLLYDDDLDYQIITNKNYYFQMLDTLNYVLSKEPKNNTAFNLKIQIYNLMGEEDLCKKTIDEYIQVDKFNPEPHYMRGFYSNTTKNAIKNYNVAISYDSSYVLAYKRLAIEYNSLGNDNQALLYYNKAIEVDSINKGGDIDPQRFKDRSDYFLSISNIKKSIADIDRAIKIDSEKVEWYYYKALIYFRIYDYENALNSLKIIDRKDSLYSSAIYLKARIYNAQSKNNLALKEMKRLLEIKESPDYYSGIAHVYAELNLYEEALKSSEKAIELEIRDKDKYLTLRGLNVHEKMGNYELAINDYSLAIFYNPNNIKNYAARASAYHEIEKYNDALSDYNKCLEIDSLYETALNNRALIFHEIGETRLAINEMEKLIKIVKDDPLYYSNLRFYHSEIKQYDEALKYSTKAIESEEINKDYYYILRAFLHQDLENYDYALKDYNNAISYDPKESLNYKFRAELFKKLKKYDLAIDDYLNAYDITNDVDILVKIAFTYSLKNDKIKAERFYKKAFEIDSLNPTFFLFRSKHWIRSKNFAQAEKDLLSLIQIEKDDPEGYYYLARLYFRNNQLFLSSRYYTLAIDKFNDGFVISDEDDTEELTISDLFLERAEIYKLAGEKKLMCEDYLSACELGSCNMYYKSCK